TAPCAALAAEIAAPGRANTSAEAVNRSRRLMPMVATPVLAQILLQRMLARRARDYRGIRGRQCSLSGLPQKVAGVTLPDTPAALAAGDLARAACPAFLYNHCMRTFVFAALLAERDHVSYDGEMIFVAAALHDLGLTKRYATAEQPFEMDGADAATEFLIKRGVTEARAELVWNAIAMHASTLAA